MYLLLFISLTEPLLSFFNLILHMPSSINVLHHTVILEFLVVLHLFILVLQASPNFPQEPDFVSFLVTFQESKAINFLVFILMKFSYLEMSSSMKMFSHSKLLLPQVSLLIHLTLQLFPGLIILPHLLLIFPIHHLSYLILVLIPPTYSHIKHISYTSPTHPDLPRKLTKKIKKPNYLLDYHL